MLSELLTSREEEEALRQREKIRRKGHQFIKVINEGPESYNRIHSVEDMELFDIPDYEKGGITQEKRKVCRALTFNIEKGTGDRIAYVLDTEYNRYWLARQLDYGLKIDDERMQKEIEKLVNKPYKIELTRKDELERKKRELEKELRFINKESEETKGEDDTVVVKRDSISKKKKESSQINIPKNTTEGVF